VASLSLHAALVTLPADPVSGMAFIRASRRLRSALSLTCGWLSSVSPESVLCRREIEGHVPKLSQIAISKISIQENELQRYVCTRANSTAALLHSESGRQRLDCLCLPWLHAPHNGVVLVDPNCARERVKVTVTARSIGGKPCCNFRDRAIAGLVGPFKKRAMFLPGT
jgi:hypothetical protein